MCGLIVGIFLVVIVASAIIAAIAGSAAIILVAAPIAFFIISLIRYSQAKKLRSSVMVCPNCNSNNIRIKSRIEGSSGSNERAGRFTYFDKNIKRNRIGECQDCGFDYPYITQQEVEDIQRKSKRNFIISIIILVIFILISIMAALAEPETTEEAEGQNTISEQSAPSSGKTEIEPSSEVQYTPLTDFYITMNAENSITLNSFETHNKKCLIAKDYTIDGEQWKVTEIGDACFFGRTSLETLVIPEGVTTIAHNAFNSCSVKELYLPSTLTNINKMFDYLHKEIDVYYAGSQEQWNGIGNLGEVPNNVTLHFNTPAIIVEDSTDYKLSDLVKEKSQAEELGGALGNALNGIVSGFVDGMNENN